MELDFPLEFIVNGTPVSAQARRPESIVAWKDRVKEASRASLPEGHFAFEDQVGVTIYYVPDTEMQGDIDNIVKPILDALCKHIYIDDRQVERVLVQKFEPGRVFEFQAPSAALGDALNAIKPATYVRLSNDPFEDLA